MIFSLSAPLLTVITYLGISQKGKETLNSVNATGSSLVLRQLKVKNDPFCRHSDAVFSGNVPLCRDGSRFGRYYAELASEFVFTFAECGERSEGGATSGTERADLLRTDIFGVRLSDAASSGHRTPSLTRSTYCFLFINYLYSNL